MTSPNLTPTANALAQNLRLERVREDVFSGVADGFGTPNTYGGQLIGQAMSAACQCVTGRPLHSLHAYFLRAGCHSKSVEYRVTRLRDGGHFSARRVEAWQDDAMLFSATGSFHAVSENVDHQAVPSPDGALPTDYPAVDMAKLSVALGRPGKPHPLDAFEARGELSCLSGAVRSATNTLWFRWRGDAETSTELHASLFGWLSDFFLLPTALRLSGHHLLAPELKIASLDHALWLHRPFSLSNWLRFDFTARVLSHSRAHASADVFDLHGRLVASLAQEGVLHVRHKP